MDRIHIKATKLNDPFPDSDSEGGKKNGPFYIQLGAAETPQTLRSKLAGQEEGCPVAK